MKKSKRRNWDDVRWTPFERIEPPVAGDLPNNQLWAEEGLAKWFANSIYVVRLIAVRAPAPFGVVVCLTVRTHDHQPRHDWRELQRIKNEIMGEETEAVEVFPSEDRLVDNSNYYHLFCFPHLGTEDGKLPFGFPERLVTEGSGEAGRQRDFRPELRADDVVHPNAPGARGGGPGADERISGRCSYDGSAIVVRGAEATHEWNGKPVRMLRGECRKHGHVVLVAAKEDVEAAEKGAPAGAAHGAPSGARGPE